MWLVSEPAPPDAEPVYGPDDVERRAVPRQTWQVRDCVSWGAEPSRAKSTPEAWYDEGTRRGPR